MFDWQAETLSVGAGEYCRLLDSLLGHGRCPHEKRACGIVVDDTLMAIAASRIVRATTQLLLARDIRQRPVLRDGQRLLARSIDHDVALNFTKASESLLHTLGAQLPAFITPAQLSGKTTLLREQKKLGLGDQLFFFLVGRNLARTLLDDSAAQKLQRRLQKCSPFYALYVLDSASAAVLAENGILLECLGAMLSTSWKAQLESTLFDASLSAKTAALRNYVTMLDDHRRLDLMTPVFDVLRPICQALAAQDDVRQFIRLGANANSIQDGETALRRVADLLGIVDEAAVLFDALRLQRFGDARYHEAQLYYDLYQRALVPWLQEAEEVLRLVRGRMG